MIKANELRIGNLVNAHTGKIHQINAASIVAQSQYDLANAEGYKPIPLTEEILLKAGFAKHNGGNYRKGLWMLKPDFVKGAVIGYGLFSLRLDWVRLNENSICNVHQLQNLFFAVSGHELDVLL